MKNTNDNFCTADTLDWNPLADLIDPCDIAEAASPFLETEEYTSYTEYDALNRPISLTTPDGSVNLPTYNEAGLLDKVQACLRGASVDDATPFVTNINYDAKGQRELVEYANGVYTEYTYDPLTFRVIRIHTIRTKDNACLQDLNYTYDPVGNITELRDNAQKTIFYDNAGVEPVNHYEYDALYRLIHAEGREHAGQNADAQSGHHNPPIINTPHPNDAQAMRNYTEDYAYDEVGNIEHMDHKFANGGWKRNYEYEEVSNRLESTSLSGDDPEGPYGAPYPYGHDEHGNMTSMPHLPEMCWDFKDQMCQVDLNGGGAAYYVYDSGGQRARKVHEHNGSTVEERIYLGGYEIYRKHNGTGLTLERETLHIMDDQQRIALVETKTINDGSEVSEPESLVRYQLNNHLGSSSMELDEDGVEISYEEYYPYGSTSYQWTNSKISRKRYRYTGKERDDETGLYYYGARYYAAWLGRWVSADPSPSSIFTNLYAYAANSPVVMYDSTGLQEEWGLLSQLKYKWTHAYMAVRLTMEIWGSVIRPWLHRVDIPKAPIGQLSEPVRQGWGLATKQQQAAKMPPPKVPKITGVEPPPLPPPPPAKSQDPFYSHPEERIGVKQVQNRQNMQKQIRDERIEQRKKIQAQKSGTKPSRVPQSQRGAKGPSPSAGPKMGVAGCLLSFFGMAVLLSGAAVLAAHAEGYYHTGPMNLPEGPMFRVVAAQGPNESLRYVTITTGYEEVEIWGRSYHVPISHTVEFPEGSIEAVLIFSPALGEYKLHRYPGGFQARDIPGAFTFVDPPDRERERIPTIYLGSEFQTR